MEHKYFYFCGIIERENCASPVTAPRLEAHDSVEACDDVDGSDDDTGAVTAAVDMLTTAGAAAEGLVRTAVLGTITGN